MDARFATQEGVYQIFEAAERVPGLLDVSIGGWLAWPAAKASIYARLFAAAVSSPRPRRPNLARVAAAVARVWPARARVHRALQAVPARGARPRIAWLVGTRPSVGPDSVTRDSVFDELPADLAAHAEQVWLSPPVVAAGTAGIDAQPAYAAANRLAGALEPLQRYRPAIRSAASAMTPLLSNVAASAGHVSWHELIVDALSDFESRRLAWSRVFRTIRPHALVATDAAYLAGEIAAAKESGVRVAEFQHGLFGRRCPEYGWSGTFAHAIDRMPVADRVLVFGELFRGAALHNGFWPSDAVRVIGSPALERHRRALAGGPPPAHGPVRLLFFTQSISRDEAVRFWGEFLALDGNRPSSSLTIKVHPEERAQMRAYAALAERFPGRVTLAGADADPLTLIRAHDMVASYTSNALIEAVGLGRPAVSIAGSQAPAGLFGLCPIPGAGDDIIHHVAAPADLLHVLTALAPNGAGDAARALTAASRGFYDEGRAGAALRECLDLLNV